MTHLHELLKQKENELARLEKEIEALRLVVELVAEGHSKVTSTGNDARRIATAIPPALAAEAAVRNVPFVPPSIAAPGAVEAPPTATNGGAKRFP